MSESQQAFAGGDQEELQTLRDRVTELERLRREHDRAEAELRRSEQCYQAIVENQSELVSRHTRGGILTFVNDSLARYTGRAREELLGQSLFRFIPDDERERLMEHLDSLDPANPVGMIEHRGILPNGDVCWQQWSNRAIFDEQERLIEYQSVGRDITQLKSVEEELRESEARYRNLFDRVPLGLYRSTPDGRILAANPALVRMLGYPDLASFLTADVCSLYAESSDRQRLLQEIDRDGVALDLEFRLRRYDGAQIWVRENARAVGDAKGAVLCYEGSLEDITERRRAQDKLRKERDFSTTLLKTSPAFFVAISAEGKTLMMNEAMLTALGYTEDEVIGTNYLETFVTGPDHELVRSVFDKLVHLREPTLNENRVLTKDGRELLVEWRGRLVFSESGQLEYFFGVGIDITERRQAEEERAKVEAQLRHAHKMQAVGQLAAGVAHDFNSILTVILANAERVLSRIQRGQDDCPEALALRQIMSSVERGAALVQRLLTFGRARAGRPQALDLDRIVADMEKMLRPLIGDQIELRVLPGSGTKPIFADPGQIEEVIMNLILNARDAMPDGGRLTIETAPVVLDDACAGAPAEAKPGSYTRLAVSDTGGGMNEETVRRLFEPFFTTKPVDRGTGLGLSIVHGIVTQAGGHIEVTSEPGQGSTFRLYFRTVD